jgi:hypothetical protein
MRFKWPVAVFWTPVIFATVHNPVQFQPSGIHGPRWGFAAAMAGPGGKNHLRLTTSWNANENSDTVLIVIGRSRTIPVDSVRLFLRSGPRPRWTLQCGD